MRLNLFFDTLFSPAYVAIALLMAVWIGALGNSILAQPVQRTIRLEQASPERALGLEAIRTEGDPIVGLYRNRLPANLETRYGERVREAYRQWELFLLGLEIPYRVLEDTSAVDGVPASLEIVILPGSLTLSGPEQRAIEGFARSGGGVILNGLIGFFDGRGRMEGSTFLSELLEVTVRNTPVDVSSPWYVALQGGKTLTEGITPGYQFVLNPEPPLFAAYPLEQDAEALLVLPDSMDAFIRSQGSGTEPAMLMKNNLGLGRVAWIGFYPQQLGRKADTQNVYQQLLLNALAYAGAYPAASINAWPDGNQSAVTFTALPSIGHRPFQYLGALKRMQQLVETEEMPLTYFPGSEEVALYPDLVESISQTTEIGLAGDRDDLLYGLPLEEQASRLTLARAHVEPRALQFVNGLVPPGGFYDEHTVRAMQEAELTILLTPGSRHYSVPNWVDWKNLTDFRSLPDSSTSRTVLALSYPDQPIGDVKEFEEAFVKAHRAGGLYMPTFYPEYQLLLEENAEKLRGAYQTVRKYPSWVTTVGAVEKWWKQRSSLSLTFEKGSGNKVLIIENAGDQEVEGVVLTVSMPGVIDLQVDAPGIQTQVEAMADGRYHIHIRSLAPGQQRLILSH